MMASSDHPFSATAFDLLAGLHALPSKTFYMLNKARFQAEVEAPFRQLFLAAGRRLPLPLQAALETERGLFSRILKNDWGHGGAWDHYWGAFYPKGERRLAGVQLLASIHFDSLLWGFYISDYGAKQRERFRDNCRRLRNGTGRTLAGLVAAVPGLDVFLADPAGSHYWFMAGRLAPAAVIASSQAVLAASIATAVADLYPLALLAQCDDPLPAIHAYAAAQRGEPPPG